MKDPELNNNPCFFSENVSEMKLDCKMEIGKVKRDLVKKSDRVYFSIIPYMSRRHQ